MPILSKPRENVDRQASRPTRYERVGRTVTPPQLRTLLFLTRLFMTIRLLLTTVAAAATVFCSADAFAADSLVTAAPAPSTDRIIVKYRSGNGPFPTFGARLAATVAGNHQGVGLVHVREMTDRVQVFKLSRKLTHDQVEIMAKQLRAGDPNVEYAEPDRLLQHSFVPNDSFYSQQWDLFDSTAGIRAPAAWDRSTGRGVTVAVIDTGVRPHADLLSNLLPGYNFISDPFVSGNGRNDDSTDPGDAVAANYCGTGSRASNSSWHGTHVSGIVAATANNVAGVAGVAFNAKVVPLRVLGRCGGYTSDIADAINWAAGNYVAGAPQNPNPAKVLNLSLGGDGLCGMTLQSAITAARAKGSVVVVAAGNNNADAGTTFPANCNGVVAVAATSINGGKASYSNFGSNVTLAAPGGDGSAGILSTLNAGLTTPGVDSYASYMGTSMATPVVAGVVALMFSVNSRLTPDQVADMLKKSARPFLAQAPCVNCGAGIVDANAAVALAAAAIAPPGEPTPAPAPTPVSGNGVNHSISSAQVVDSFPSLVSAALKNVRISDYYKVTIAPNSRFSITLSAGASSGFGLSLLLLDGRTIFAFPGVLGEKQIKNFENSGAVPIEILIRVYRSAGALGAYQLLLAP